MRTFIFILILFHGFKSLGQTTSEVKFSNVTINSMGDIHWTLTYHRSPSFSIHIEKLINGKWTRIVGGQSGIALYDSEPQRIDTMTNTNRVKFHKGVNVYRLVMTVPDKVISEEIKLESIVSNDDGSLWIVNNKIILDEKVQYEILNAVGSTLTKGEDEIIDISIFPTGSYFLYTKTWTKPFTK